MSKLGNRESDYEDSFSYDLEKMKFAIADGASNSIFSDVWSRSLTESFITEDVDLFSQSVQTVVQTVMDKARSKWYSSINWTTLPWFTKNKSVNGSYSTILFCQLRERDSEHLQMRIIAVGDSCLFKIRGDDITFSFPLTYISQFNISPDLVWSGRGYPFPEKSPSKYPVTRVMDGVVEASDQLVFATDSVSVLLLSDPNPMTLVTEIIEKRFTEKLIKAIDSGKIKNDDVTLALVGFR